jgi:hypothetical protein
VKVERMAESAPILMTQLRLRGCADVGDGDDIIMDDAVEIVAMRERGGWRRSLRRCRSWDGGGRSEDEGMAGDEDFGLG